MLLKRARAFDMPARPPASPGRLPAGKVVRRRLPKHEIRRVALERGNFHPRPRLHRLARATRKLAIVGVRRHMEERSEERRLGKGGVMKGRSRWEPVN